MSGQQNTQQSGDGQQQQGQQQNDQTQQQGQNNGQQQNASGGTEQQQGNSLGLLAGAEQQNDGDDSGNQNGQNDNGQTGGQQGQRQGQFMTAADVESALDRRLNVVLREVRNGRDSSDDDNGNAGSQQQRGGQQGNRGQQQTHSGPSREDLRDARSAYREYVSDDLRFLGPEEREFARGLADSRIQSRLARGEDPDDVGRDAARHVSTEVKRLREFYEARVVAELRRRGLLPQNTGSQQQAQQGGQQGPGTAGSQYTSGAAKAQQMFADRIPQPQK